MYAVDRIVSEIIYDFFNMLSLSQKFKRMIFGLIGIRLSMSLPISNMAGKGSYL